MIASLRSQTIERRSPATLVCSQRESTGVRESYPLPTSSALTESPDLSNLGNCERGLAEPKGPQDPTERARGSQWAAHSSPGSASLRAQPWVKIYKSSAADCEAARS